jgi:hypothetical protein
MQLPFEPAEPTSTTLVHRTGPSALRIAIVGAGLIAIFAGAAMTLASNQPAASATLTTSTADAVLANALDGDALVFEGRGPGHHFGFREITITAINGSNLSLTTTDGWTRTITVASATTYAKAGETIALADLEVGDQIHFRQTLEDDGTYTIDAIVVVLPHVGGEVTAVSGSTITVEQRDGTSATIEVTADTTYRVGDDDSAALSDIAVGAFVVAEGTENADGSLTAARVVSRPDGPRGHWHRIAPGDSSGDSSTSG